MSRSAASSRTNVRRQVRRATRAAARRRDRRAARRARLLAVGAAAAATAVVVRRAADRRHDAPVAEAPPLPAGRPRTVRTEDGLALSVVEHGAETPTATVVLAHGYVQSSRLWAGQVRDLVELRPDLRVVVYDHRGHGRSDRTPRERATLEQLGRDFAAVLDEVAPGGPVVVAGHSMGGMTIMALAEQRPELFEGRVVGAAFVGTSSGGLADVDWGLPAPLAKVARRLLPVLNERAARAEARGRTRTVSPAELYTIFPRGVDKALVRQAREVHQECSAETVAAFLDTFTTHDRLAALEALAHAPALVVVGDKDLLCPLAHSQAIADALPDAELVVHRGVGHMVHLERREEVSRALVDLVDRALERRPAAANG